MYKSVLFYTFKQEIKYNRVVNIFLANQSVNNLNSELLVHYSNHDLNNKPYDTLFWTIRSNPYSDPH